MASEIELKLRLSPARIRKLREHPLLAGTSTRKRRLFSTYYDTPDGIFRSRGFGLRLRRDDAGEWFMAVKGKPLSPGCLAQRREWEGRTREGAFDFDLIDDAKVRAFFQSHQSRLRSVFTTDFTREVWLVHYAGACIELAVDRGRISTPDASGALTSANEAICELELELKQGDAVTSLFDLAIELAASVHLHPEASSKADRGFALAGFLNTSPVVAASSAVREAMSLPDAFRTVALSCITHLQLNEAGVHAGEDPEYIHQGRVAIRRLRTALKLFSPALPAGFQEKYDRRWRKIAECLGMVRDWDVFLGNVMGPLSVAFPGARPVAAADHRAAECRRKAWSLARRVLGSQEYSRLVLEFSADLFRLESSLGRGRKAVSGGDVHAFAVRQINRYARAVGHRIAGVISSDAARQHELRIRLKRLRYAIDFLSPVLPEKKLRAFQKVFLRLQEGLGRLNDLMVANRLLLEIFPQRGADALFRGWIAGQAQICSAAMDADVRRLASMKRLFKRS